MNVRELRRSIYRLVNFDRIQHGFNLAKANDANTPHTQKCFRVHSLNRLQSMNIVLCKHSD